MSIQATTNITIPNIESPPIRLAPLDISNGLPPPVPPESAFAAGVDLVDEVLVATDPFLELDVEVEVVVVLDAAEPPPIPPSADSIDVEEDDDVDVVLVEVDFTVTETTEVE
ncbi:uncharacterized protein PAC_07037 [Phialocephala subalpina]|uniref:Uncharacterized protein n=1 Tax=Phialocephala subalpina TaxID=576137 RepID=A0A1L7WWJ3_9HELO|nr:uncharacterized protein PAC_07037 [Phialocephala subalpina]